MISLEHRDLALTVGAFGRTASVFNLVSESRRFGLGNEDARSVIDSVVAVVHTWKEVFEQSGVSAGDIEYLAPALLPECFFWEEPPQGLPGDR